MSNHEPGLRIALLTHDPDNPSNRRLRAAAAARGHALEPIETLRCALAMGPDGPDVWLGRERLGRYDALIPRIGPAITAFGCAVARHFVLRGAMALNTPEAIAASRDKLEAHQRLTRAGVAMPRTVFGSGLTPTDDMIAHVGGPPLLAKPIRGSQGLGIVLATDWPAARALLAQLQAQRSAYLLQAFVAESAGRDVRLIVVGGRVVAAIARQAQPGEFRANLHRGGAATAIDPTPEEARLALLATGVLGLDAAGVDLVRSDAGPLVLEVNSSPGLAGVETATGADVAGAMLDLLAARVRAAPPPL